MKPLYFLLSFVLLLVSCQSEKQNSNTLKSGIYRGELVVKKDVVIPFNFEVKSKKEFVFRNAEERIVTNEVRYFSEDSIRIKFPVFEGYLKAKIKNNTILKGEFVIEGKERKMLFNAKPSKVRFDIPSNKSKKSLTTINGAWETVFSPNTTDSYIAKGIFKQAGEIITGTFRTNTGDYRFLEGVMVGNTFMMSAFDGAHAFLFKGEVQGSNLKGVFYSGNHWEEPFIATKNDLFELPDPDTLTYLKPGFNQIDFSFETPDGLIVSLNNERFKNKAVIVQIMGTWCPNCLDESTYLSSYYETKPKGVEVIGLAFEYVKTKEKAMANINRLKKHLDIQYPIALAQYGSASKQSANKKLPMLNHVLSYPTTLFINKNKEVVYIHTGFNGPATGEKYEAFKVKFAEKVEELLKEESN